MRLRKEKGLSQEALAHEVDMDRSYLSNVETAVTGVGIDLIEKIAQVLEVDPADLLRRATKPAGARNKR